MMWKPRKEETQENFGQSRASATAEILDVLEIGKHITGAKASGHLRVVGD